MVRISREQLREFARQGDWHRQRHGAGDRAGKGHGGLKQRGLRGKRIAVERNGEIVPRSVFDHAALSPGDRVEIVIAVGGG